MQQSSPTANPHPTNDARELSRIFADIPDTRVLGRCKHKLGDILTIALCTTLCGNTEFTEMEGWGQLNEEWLATFLDLPNGIPSHDVFREVLIALEPELFLEAFLLWVNGVREKTGEGVVALDGKACRGTKGAPGEMLTIVGAFASSQGISLGQLQVEGKSNEITAVPKLLDMLDLEGCTITADAMACQKDIVAKCREKGADYAIALKGNQGNLLKEVTTYLGGMIDGGLTPGHVSEEKGTGEPNAGAAGLSGTISPDGYPTTTNGKAYVALSQWNSNVEKEKNRPPRDAIISQALHQMQRIWQR